MQNKQTNKQKNLVHLSNAYLDSDRTKQTNSQLAELAPESYLQWQSISNVLSPPLSLYTVRQYWLDPP